MKHIKYWPLFEGYDYENKEINIDEYCNMEVVHFTSKQLSRIYNLLDKWSGGKFEQIGYNDYTHTQSESYLPGDFSIEKINEVRRNAVIDSGGLPHFYSGPYKMMYKIRYSNYSLKTNHKSYAINIFFEACEDEWFKVIIQEYTQTVSGYGPFITSPKIFYKCDQIEGLLKLIDETFKKIPK